MTEYIERETAIRTLCDATPHTCNYRDCGKGCKDAQALSLIPAVDVAPARHARNICGTVPKHCEFKCSLCGAELSTVYGGENDFGMDGGYLKYCPNCGAKIDEEG